MFSRARAARAKPSKSFLESATGTASYLKNIMAPRDEHHFRDDGGGDRNG
jgi:hypothetical protein